MYDNRPIGVFDSGIGGISVLKELVSLMPNENFIYFGDSANAPYGDKPFSVVEKLALQTTESLLKSGVKAIVVACNTATAAAIDLIRDAHPQIPIIGIEPALKPAVLRCPGQTVLVMATTVTLAEPKFLHLLETYKNQADIRTLAALGLVEFIERGDTDSPALFCYLQSLLSDYLKIPPNAVVLGCTHYPFIKNALRKLLGKQVYIVDGGAGTAKETLRQLTARGIAASPDVFGSVVLQNSDPEKIPLSEFLLHL